MKKFNQSTFVLVTLTLLFFATRAPAYYDPGVQRWINRDPILEKGGLNLHAFVGNLPISRIDRFGRAWRDDLPRAPEGGWGKLCCYAHLASKRGEIHDRAASEARNAPGIGGIGHNGGPEDALRHCLGGCYLAKEVAKTPSCSKESVDKMIDSEEQRSARVTETDAANGKVGAGCPAGTGCLDYCLKAWVDGRLRTEDPPPWPVIVPRIR